MFLRTVENLMTIASLARLSLELLWSFWRGYPSWQLSMTTSVSLKWFFNFDNIVSDLPLKMSKNLQSMCRQAPSSHAKSNMTCIKHVLFNQKRHQSHLHLRLTNVNCITLLQINALFFDKGRETWVYRWLATISLLSDAVTLCQRNKKRRPPSLIR